METKATVKIAVTLAGETREVTFQEFGEGRWLAIDNWMLISKPGGKLWPERLRAWTRDGKTNVALGYNYNRLNSNGYTPRCWRDDPRVSNGSLSEHNSR